MGNKPKHVEKGHMCISEASVSEVFEELQIHKSDIKATKMLGVIDDIENDPRMHGIRFIYLRWVETEPKKSDELKSIVSVPISLLNNLAERRVAWPNKEGKPLGMVLNHDKMIKLVMAHPDTQKFLTNIKERSAQQQNVFSGRVF
jgi:ADP-ribose pyrophosphatase YjhB (NUDIX family)